MEGFIEPIPEGSTHINGIPIPVGMKWFYDAKFYDKQPVVRDGKLTVLSKPVITPLEGTDYDRDAIIPKEKEEEWTNTAYLRSTEIHELLMNKPIVYRLMVETIGEPKEIGREEPGVQYDNTESLLLGLQGIEIVKKPWRQFVARREVGLCIHANNTLQLQEHVSGCLNSSGMELMRSKNFNYIEDIDKAITSIELTLIVTIPWWDNWEMHWCDKVHPFSKFSARVGNITLKE